ncbi:hypothetical protein [Desulfoferrobacter suflitae]|uniref:hypothetical protein n=1 Tax=Desulfoferrobacter suflitae TaxID=2865782 RepID=UPI0021645AC3|nr:hypothetical protein [Desulfoferrobacter suflitae]MCK8600083.1 hypothetical protein [Desulfoferrobacter suflitae]
MNPMSYLLPVSPNYWPQYGLEVHSVESALEIPAGNHFPKFVRQLDRAVFEGIPAGMREVVAAHEVFDTCPRHLRPEIIATKARCTLSEAVQLADALHILDADEKVAKAVTTWARVRSVKATLHYLHRFLVGVAEVENPSQDPDPDTPPVLGFQEIPDVRGMTCKQLRQELTRRGRTPYARATKAELQMAVIKLDQADAETDEPSPETLGYHRLGETGQQDWIAFQPAWFQKLIAMVRGCKDVSALKEIGKRVFASNLTGDRASVFWSFYNIQKRFLESRQVISKAALNFISKIREAGPREFAVFGRHLFRIQKGVIKGPAFREHEWKAIWGAYHEAKARFQQAA